MTNIKSIEQGRASYAYECAEKSKKIKDYKSHVKKIPMLIKTNGIGNTIAFIKAKDNTYTKIYEQIQEWIFNKCHNKLVSKDIQRKNNNDLAKVLVNITSSRYRSITVEVLALFNWLRRFADGLIEGGG